jgi:hypothetical protein
VRTRQDLEDQAYQGSMILLVDTIFERSIVNHQQPCDDWMPEFAGRIIITSLDRESTSHPPWLGMGNRRQWIDGTIARVPQRSINKDQ